MKELSRQRMAILSAVAALGPESAYGVAVMDEISSRERKDADFACVMVWLSRLKDEGYLVAEMRASPDRPSRRKFFYTLTIKGQTALHFTRERLSIL